MSFATAIIATVAGLFLLSCLGFFPWSPINCSTLEIDLIHGHIRYTRYLLWVPIDRVIWDSALAKELVSGDFAEVPCEWHHSVTRSPGIRHSPHYYFHAALNQIRDLESIWESNHASKSMKRSDALKILRIWRETGNTFEAGDFLNDKWKRE